MPAEDDYLKRQPRGQPLELGAWGRRLSAQQQPASRHSTGQQQGPAVAAADSSWATAAEASGWTRTSTAAETQAYAESLAASDLPHAGRLQLSQYGLSEEGRPLTLVTVAEPPLGSLADVRASEKICVHVNANIHAGEVEGKECVQQLLRELAHGEHIELLEHAVLLFSICCNPDGNEDFSIDHRVDQNGPDAVGVRPNANGLDLNRDFIKTEAAEVRGLIDVFTQADPAVFVDLHATDGSHHGYHVTYATSLSPNVDPDIAGFARTALLPDIKQRCLEQHAVRAFDYGNFRDGNPDRGEESSGEISRTWETYDHRPRFGTNYIGLRNRISVLSEVYSHLDFEERTRVSRALVLTTLQAAVANRDEILQLTAAADSLAEGRATAISYGSECELGPSTMQEVLVGSCTAVEAPQGTILVADEEYEPVEMEVFDHFVATQSTPLPTHGWAVLPGPSNDMELLLEKLQIHGIEHTVLEQPVSVAKAVEFSVEEIIVIESRTAHGMAPDGIQLDGHWLTDDAPPSATTLPAGAVVVGGEQRLVRLAAQLLEPKSTDGFFTYEVLGVEGEGKGEEEETKCPVLQLFSPPLAAGSRL
jgi:hypothetical protein